MIRRNVRPSAGCRVLCVQDLDRHGTFRMFRVSHTDAVCHKGVEDTDLDRCRSDAGYDVLGGRGEWVQGRGTYTRREGERTACVGVTRP